MAAGKPAAGAAQSSTGTAVDNHQGTGVLHPGSKQLDVVAEL